MDKTLIVYANEEQEKALRESGMTVLYPDSDFIEDSLMTKFRLECIMEDCINEALERGWFPKSLQNIISKTWDNKKDFRDLVNCAYSKVEDFYFDDLGPGSREDFDDWIRFFVLQYAHDKVKSFEKSIEKDISR